MRKLALILCMILVFSSLASLTSCSGGGKNLLSSLESKDDGTASGQSEPEETAEPVQPLPNSNRTDLNGIAREEFTDDTVAFFYPKEWEISHDSNDSVVTLMAVNDSGYYAGQRIEFREVYESNRDYLHDSEKMLRSLYYNYTAEGEVTEQVHCQLVNPYGVSMLFASLRGYNYADDPIWACYIVAEIEGHYYQFHVESTDVEDMLPAEIVYLSVRPASMSLPETPAPDVEDIPSELYTDEMVTFSYPGGWEVEERGYVDDFPAFRITDPNSYDKIDVQYSYDAMQHPQDLLNHLIDTYYYDDVVTDTVADITTNANGVTVYRTAFTYDSEYGDPGRFTILQFSVAEPYRIGYIEIYEEEPFSNHAQLVYETLKTLGNVPPTVPVPQGYVWFENEAFRFLRPAGWNDIGYEDEPSFMASDRSNITVERIRKSQLGQFMNKNGTDYRNMMYNSMLSQSIIMQSVTARHGTTENGLKYSLYEFEATKQGVNVYTCQIYFYGKDDGYLWAYAGTQQNSNLINTILNSIEIK